MQRSTVNRLVLTVGLTSLIALGVFWLRAQRTCAEATATLARHFDALRHGDIDAAMSHYSAEFFQQPKRDQDRWRASITSLGALRKYDSTALAGHYGFGGDRVSFAVETVYEKRSCQEDFELFRRRGATNFVILHHDFD